MEVAAWANARDASGEHGGRLGVVLSVIDGSWSGTSKLKFNQMRRVREGHC
jgi:hypothetical protein